jgi:hypothetical protein
MTKASGGSPEAREEKDPKGKKPPGCVPFGLRPRTLRETHTIPLSATIRGPPSAEGVRLRKISNMFG